jgi:hypothetical protein
MDISSHLVESNEGIEGDFSSNGIIIGWLENDGLPSY